MQALNSAAWGCICITAAIISFVPLLFSSPLVLFRGPTTLLRIWGAWLSMLVYGLGYLVCSGMQLYHWIYERTVLRHQYLAEKHEREPAGRMRSEAATSSRPQHSKPILAPRRRTSSYQPHLCIPAQMPDLSRRPSIQAEHDHALYMANTFGEHIRESDKNYGYAHDMSPGGASRLSSRRSSRVDLASGYTTPRVAASGTATPLLVRSRTGSFNFGALPASMTGSTSSLGQLALESNKRHKRTHTGG